MKRPFHFFLLAFVISAAQSAFSSMQIDDATVDILNAIGWKTFTIADKIVGSGISSNGIGSAYEPHTFTLNSSQQDAEDYEWTLIQIV